MELREAQTAVEAVSVGYAAKFGLTRDTTWFLLKLQEEVGELTKAFVDLHGMGRDRGLPEDEQRSAFVNECADVLAHLLLLAEHEGVDLDEAIRTKWLSWL